MTQKEVDFRKNQRAELKAMLKDIEKTLNAKLDKAFNCYYYFVSFFKSWFHNTIVLI